MTTLQGATWSSGGVTIRKRTHTPQQLQHVDCNGWGSNHLPSDRWMTALPRDPQPP